MKTLIQIDMDCIRCNGKGTVVKEELNENNNIIKRFYKCRGCQGTGKELKWITVRIGSRGHMKVVEEIFWDSGKKKGEKK